MKAEIDENGMLTIRAETPIERFALRKWSEKDPEVTWPKHLTICWAAQVPKDEVKP